MSSLLKALDYDSSANFIRAEDASRFGSSAYGHLCRKAVTRGLGFQGVYTLKPNDNESATPVVALFQVSDESQAKEIHRLLWNQDFIPFILVEGPSSIRLYSGFSYKEAPNGESDLIAPLRDFNRIQEHLGGFRAEEIDNGTLWSKWGQHVDPTQRVDWHLLDNLAKLGNKLREDGLSNDVSHAFIGRYVYLRYLKDRGFLSERKLAKWGLQEADIFSRNATLKAFKRLNDKLDGETDGLNGSVFPFAISRISKQHLLTVASAFAGDDPATGQTVLNFAVYDFSYIPIETLSIIYEQFLHEPAKNGGTSRARQQGAYYTPITLVNFMLSEMDSRHPLQPEMKVLDPSCGSGAFLVQTYRMLIERAIQQSGGHSLNPSQLREILQTQIFGVDRDQDACRIAEMSLLVTLLDYVNPPDLEGKFKGFLLPTLANRNIFEADFFDESSAWQEELTKRNSPAPFDWVVGNPPWKEIKNPPKDPLDQKALTWMLKGDTPPTGGNQLAEAFIWKSQPLMKAGAIAGVVLPAMTLFKSESTPFRKALFTHTEKQSIVNFSNLCYVLFSGRTAVPAMSLFFQNPAEEPRSNTPVQVYSPFVIDQEANRPKRAGKQLDTWTLTVDGDDVREIPLQQAAKGDALTWKLAMWGSERDHKLLERLSRKFLPFEQFAKEQRLAVSEGIQLRSGEASSEAVEHHPELEGSTQINFGKLKNCGRILKFPENVFSTVPADRCWVRKGRALRPIAASSPPLIMVPKTRAFAIFRDEFTVVPPRQIGISSPEQTSGTMLRALAVYLNSDFALYHQFFESSEWGIQMSISTLKTLKKLPIPDLAKYEGIWAQFHLELENKYSAGEQLEETDQKTINSFVSKALGLRPYEQQLIEDFVRVNLLKVKGKVTQEAIRTPSPKELKTYLNTLQKRLDSFMQSDARPASHQLSAVFDSKSAMIELALHEADQRPPQIIQADDAGLAEFSRVRKNLLKQNSQWIYFNRRLRIYSKGKLYLFKPLQRIQWTARQAILDADDLIAEALSTLPETTDA